MEIGFADSFWESIKKIGRRNRWYMKVYDLFRYDIPHYIRNWKRFNKCLWRYRSWEGQDCLLFLETALKYTGETLEKYGNEIEISRLKKIAKIKRVCEIMNNINQDCYIEMAEKKLGKIDWEIEPDADEKGFKFKMYKDEESANHASAVFDLVRKMEEDEWKELWKTLEGQPKEEFDKIRNESILKKGDDYYEIFDGSGLMGWWD